MYLIIIYLLELFNIILDRKFNILTFNTHAISFIHHKLKSVLQTKGYL